MLKFGTPTIAPPLAIKKCTVQTGCTGAPLFTLVIFEVDNMTLMMFVLNFVEFCFILKLFQL